MDIGCSAPCERDLDLVLMDLLAGRGSADG